MFDCVVAADAADGIGKDGDLPWPRLDADLAFLRRITSQVPPDDQGRPDGAAAVNAVIMGRLTWESVPSGKQPLPGRVNVVVSRRSPGPAARAELALPPGVLHARSLEEALSAARAQAGVAGLFVIGGAALFQHAFAHPDCRFVYLTRIAATFDCDTFLPPLAPRFHPAEVLARHRQHGIDFEIQRWQAG